MFHLELLAFLELNWTKNELNVNGTNVNLTDDPIIICSKILYELSDYSAASTMDAYFGNPLQAVQLF